MTAEQRQRWWELAVKEHLRGKTRTPAGRQQLRGLLRDQWAEFAKLYNLPLTEADYRPPPSDALPPVTFVHVHPSPVPTPVAPTVGPGSELTALLASCGIVSVQGCGCSDYAATMNAWGIEGCIQRRQEIVAWLRSAYNSVSWAKLLTAGSRAAISGWVYTVSLTDPLGSLVDLAIARARAKVTS